MIINLHFFHQPSSTAAVNMWDRAVITYRPHSCYHDDNNYYHHHHHDCACDYYYDCDYDEVTISPPSSYTGRSSRPSHNHKLRNFRRDERANRAHRLAALPLQKSYRHDLIEGGVLGGHWNVVFRQRRGQQCFRRWTHFPTMNLNVSLALTIA